MKRLLFLFCLTTLISCSSYKSVPHPKTEFRGVWVATVVNIDWPKNGNDSVQKQKEDFLEILDFYEHLNFNAAIVQIRAAGDAFYDSQYAPWSRYLTGIEGTPPDSQIDLLKWMIDETHERGMEFHAWLNPYRATFDLDTESLSPLHDFHQFPEWMLKYGKKYYYNPGLPQVRERLVAIMKEVVTKYDIDAIHFDDYFYPYKITNEVFADSLVFQQYAQPEQTLDDWRRSNVDSLVKNIHSTISSIKPWVQFGISPFGVWKNKSTDSRGSDTQAGQTTYDDLYADPLLWVQNGWIDYVAPQAYWSMNLPVASHKTIVKWWAENALNSNLYIGNGSYKVRNNSDRAWRKKRELPNQIALARKTQGVTGNVFFSAKSLMQKNKDVKRVLRRKFYKQKALTPASPLTPKKENNGNALVSCSKTGNTVTLNFSFSENQRYALIYQSEGRPLANYPMDKMIIKKFLNGNSSLTLSKKTLRGEKQIAVTLLNNFRRESGPIIVNLKKIDDPKR